MESRHDHFVLDKTTKKWTITFAGSAKGKEVAQAQQRTRRNLAWSAVEEITDQLQAMGGEGSVHIKDWKQRYQPHLGDFFWFVEERSDKFTLDKTRSDGWIVGFAEGNEDAFTRTSRTMRWDKSMSKKKKQWGDAGTAIFEIKEKLRPLGGRGIIKIDDWDERFKDSLGTFKVFFGIEDEQVYLGL